MGDLDRKARRIGYRDYAHYVQSEHWTSVRLHYAAAWPGCCCLACGADIWQLHHLRYDRLGGEFFRDLLPFCKPCHDRLHDVHRAYGWPLREYAKAMTVAFGWSPFHLYRRLHPWTRLGIGTVVPGEDHPVWTPGNTKAYVLTDPDGREHRTTRGLNEACRRLGLSEAVMRNVVAGRTKQHRGWTARLIVS